jgi:hypothetical protein
MSGNVKNEVTSFINITFYTELLGTLFLMLVLVKKMTQNNKTGMPILCAIPFSFQPCTYYARKTHFTFRNLKKQNFSQKREIFNR